MESAAIPIMQVVCLVLVGIAIVNVNKCLRNVNEATKNMKVKFKEIDDAIASLQRRKTW